MAEESTLESKCRLYAQAKGCDYYKFVSPGNTGVPDRMITAYPKRVMWVEFKAKGNYATPKQLFEIARLHRKGHEAYVIDNFDSFKLILDGFVM